MKTGHTIIALITIGVLVGIYFMSDRGNVVTPVQIDSYSTSTAPEASLSTSTIPTTSTNSIKSMHTVTIETDKGTIVFETYDTEAPKASANFVTLAKKGFYNGVIFHRVIEGFMIQGGDPEGTGRGGPGYTFADELDPNKASAKEGYKRGVVAMANAGPDTNGSQFFIMHKDYPLDYNYTIFGKVISGMDVVDAIAQTPVGAGSRPVNPPVMKKVTVSDKK